MPERVLAGVDIGGTKTAVVLSRNLPDVLARHEFATEPQNGPAPALDQIIRSLHEAIHRNGLAVSDVRAIGISCGNPLDPVRGIIQSPPNLKSWKSVPICELLQSEFGAPCFLENDANAGALAEASYGAGRNVKDFIFLTMGTGFGAGLILDGRLHRGATNAAGEIGHVRLTRSGPRGYGKAGSAEGWASGGGMAQVARMYVRAAQKRGEPTSLAGGPQSRLADITARDVAFAAKAGDKVAQSIIRKVGERLGEALAVLIDVLNPGCIVIGGLALRMGEDLLGPARQVAKEEALPGSAEACRIIPAELGERIGDVSALCAAVEGLARDRGRENRQTALRSTPRWNEEPDQATVAGKPAGVVTS